MLFKQELAEAIVKGRKTQTRRPIKAGERLIDLDGKLTVFTAGNRMKFQVGRDYAVCYGRGKPMRWWGTFSRNLVTWEQYQEFIEAYGDNFQHHLRQVGRIPMRIRITNIRQEDVREISSEDGVAEGFGGKWGFLDTWCRFYDKKAVSIVNSDGNYSDAQVHVLMTGRPAGLYQAWVYDFELLEEI